MTKQAKVVIGANFGDEGKGLVTDFLTNQNSDDTLVVRHNSGAQAGHTVTTPDGGRHVFKHFGSGTLAGASTFLSRFYACHPMLFSRELKKLSQFDIVKPTVYVDSKAPITTPYDMMINEVTEIFRGANRHGSCGFGFGETIERSENSKHILLFEDLKDINYVRNKLKNIQDEWVPYRLKNLGVTDIADKWKERLLSEEIFERYLEEIEFFIENVKHAPDNLLQTANNIVFESAQGLQLDQDRGFFPHVTRSNTGVQNAALLAEEAGIDELEVTYITRAYNTRHGAGPMDHELPEKPYENIVDKTNIFNDYQENIRFGWLDIDTLAENIKTDFADISSSLKAKYQLAVTCLDQVEGKHSFISGGEKQSTNIGDFLNQAKAKVGATELITSYGPTRKDVSFNV